LNGFTFAAVASNALAASKMKTMRYATLISLTLLSIFAIGQNAKHLKQKIQNQIKSSVKDPTLADYWLICNTDSSYYLKDTISLFNYGTNIYDSTSCCSFVVWCFFDKTHFFCAETIVCNEPVNSKVKYKNKSYCKTAWKIDGNELFLINKIKGKKPEKYLIIDFAVKYLWKDLIGSYVLKLKRISTSS
jgi:hypothetical protein